VSLDVQVRLLSGAPNGFVKGIWYTYLVERQMFAGSTPAEPTKPRGRDAQAEFLPRLRQVRVLGGAL
jgi:hypothetical protein